MKREIQQGNSSTRARQLEAQIETLTLQNVKLQRTNRLLKVDTDNLVKQKTQPLEQTIRELTLSNVQLQRATRLLQQEVEEKSATLENFKREQIMQMKSVGPEYEYLVQMVNLLHRQVNMEQISRRESEQGECECKEEWAGLPKRRDNENTHWGENPFLDQW